MKKVNTKELEIENKLLKKLFEVISLKYERSQARIVEREQEFRDLHAKLETGIISIGVYDKLKLKLKKFFVKFYFLFRRK